jgi:phosphoribosyl-ATP pyrophosphohydrolase/phosphoribosyl-AMP cyclohydrolase
VRIRRKEELDDVAFDGAGGLVPVVAQHVRTGELLMLAWADREALERTLDSGELWLYSRSRQELWHKGATSGNTQRVVALHADCDRDAILALVEPTGPACHTGDWSCFGGLPTLPALADVLDARVEQLPAGSYTTRLLADPNLRTKKLGEEAVELATACAREDAARATEEAADLLYHVLVACRALGVTAAEILGVLEERLKRE